jgi:hypothetical protein
VGGNWIRGSKTYLITDTFTTVLRVGVNGSQGAAVHLFVGGRDVCNHAPPTYVADISVKGNPGYGLGGVFNQKTIWATDDQFEAQVVAGPTGFVDVQMRWTAGGDGSFHLGGCGFTAANGSNQTVTYSVEGEFSSVQ